MNRFTNRNTLITGAASGIGRAAAFRIASEGGNLALLDRDSARLFQVAQELKELYPVQVVHRTCNVADSAEVQECIDAAADQLGGIQAVSHNVGILRTYHTHEMTIEQWNEIIGVNLTGTFNVNRHALPHLLKNKASYLVNTSSSAFSQPHPWLAAYAASKGGIVSFTRSLFIEYSLQGLRANCILPGGTNTPLARSFTIPPEGNPALLSGLMRFGQAVWMTPDGIAAAIAFLTSDDAFYINGTEISVDGGLPETATEPALSP